MQTERHNIVFSQFIGIFFSRLPHTKQKIDEVIDITF